ncbi:DUF2934 domain-containing protein [Halochromatium glycolicum]|jgi:microsomal dipeptidase-like Zn-dependent dipeptidase|uniref:DUF2934 domain-containing protein n=1 Tax=Halochromatium glycolicum TaxID=85075 RepID=A0AAJ0X9K5_9GAMM|nr:DUF2934 domain-containing protein [Halochromatium glycolicum]MBK1704914.1 hypothetical protein [Halochromatium glycolicum]
MIVSPEERSEMIAVAAYFLAEQRGFTPDGATDDWLTAERQIDRLLDAIRRQGISRAQFERAGLRNALRLWNGTSQRSDQG